MKYSDKFSNVIVGDYADNSHLVGESSGCTICGRPTNFIEVCSESYFCSEECETEFYSQINEQLKVRI